MMERNKMKHIKKNRMAYTLAVLLLFGLVSYLMFNQIVNQELDYRQVPVTNKQIIGGQEIQEEDINCIQVPNSEILDSVETDVIGKVVDFGSTLATNSLIPKELVKEKSEVHDIGYLDLKQGEVATTLTVNKETSYSNSIQVGHYIDIYFSGTGLLPNDVEEKIVYGELVRQARVLAIHNDETDGYGEDGDAYLVVALNYADADLVGRAVTFGEVFPVVSYDSINQEETSNYYDISLMKDAIYQRTIDITLKEVEQEDE